MYYSNGFDSTYEELITFYPAFYRDVFEMRAILEAEGGLADDVIKAINTVIDNSFVETADESMITRLEAFLGLETDKNRSLEERRRLVRAFFVGFGKLSASKIEEAIRSFTGAGSKVYFPRTDDAGNCTLIIEMERGDIPEISYADIETVLSKKIPAHIAYKAFVKYSAAVAITTGRTNYKHEYRISGLEPEVALLGKKRQTSAVTETDAAAESFGAEYLYCGTAVAGTL